MTRIFIDYLNTISINVDKALENISNTNIKFKEFGDLVIFNYKNKYGSEIERSCRGLIMDKTNKKVVCSPNMGALDLESFIKKVSFDECVIEQSYEGTLVKSYYYNNRWNISTKFCINSENSKFRSKKSFRQYFDELCNINFDTLDKHFTYSFLLQIPSNRLVTNISEKRLFHIETQNNITGEKINLDIGVLKPTILKLRDVDSLGVSSYRGINKELNNLDWNERGFMLYSIDRKYRCSLINNNYKAIYDYIKNQSDIKFLLLESIYYKKNLEKYIQYFPEYKKTEERVRSKFKELVKNLYNLYKEYYCFKTREFSEIPGKKKKILNEIHKIYKTRHRNDLLFRISLLDVETVLLTESCAYLYTLLFKI